MIMSENEMPNDVNVPDAMPIPEPVDVVAVMEEVRRRVAEKRAAGIYPPEPAGAAVRQPQAARDGEDALAKVAWSLGTMRLSSRISLEGEPVRSHRPMLGAALKAWKKFTRFWIRRYTDTLFLQQSCFNTETANAVTSLHEDVRRLRAELEELKNGSAK